MLGPDVPAGQVELRIVVDFLGAARCETGDGPLGPASSGDVLV